MKTSFLSLLALAASTLSAANAAPATAPAGVSTLKVLSFNINALPPPIKKAKPAHYARIAEILRERRAAGTQPDIVLLQEAFDGRSDIIAETAGYKYVLKGPGRKDRSKKGAAHWALKTRKGYAAFQSPQKLTGSGLVILSDHPILEARHKAFDSDMCAGIDCLSNKAILFAHIDVPHMEGGLGVINSHFNSKRSAKAPGRITFKAHKRQVETLGWFLGKVSGDTPMLIGGDFNTRDNSRYSYFRETIPYDDTAELCIIDIVHCRIGAETAPGMVLYDTSDKQFVGRGTAASLSPVHIERNFAEMIDGKPLSDHLGYEVHYRIGD